MPVNRFGKAQPEGQACWGRRSVRGRGAQPSEGPRPTTVQQAKILVADPAYPSPAVIDLVAELMSSHLLPSA
jgi:hypothetical protein